MHWSFASQRVNARFDELYVAAISVLGENVGVCCRFDVTWSVGTWTGKASCPPIWVWKPNLTGRPVCGFRVTEIKLVRKVTGENIGRTGSLRGDTCQHC